MAEENHQTTHKLDDFVSGNSDDMSVLNVLMHTIKGISPVSASRFELGLAFDQDGDE